MEVYYTLSEERAGSVSEAITLVDGTMSVTVIVVEICQNSIAQCMLIHDQNKISMEKHKPTFESVSTLPSKTVFLYL